MKLHGYFILICSCLVLFFLNSASSNDNFTETCKAEAGTSCFKFKKCCVKQCGDKRNTFLCNVSKGKMTKALCQCALVTTANIDKDAIVSDTKKDAPMADPQKDAVVPDMKGENSASTLLIALPLVLASILTTISNLQ